MQWLVDNGYTKGIAEFWCADVTTEMSDGRIEMWSLKHSNHESADLGMWLEDTSHDTMPTGQYFLLVRGDEEEAASKPLVKYSDGERVYCDKHYSIFVYDEPDALVKAIERWQNEG